ncbi:hypothetical protein CWC08_19280, partial [Pseudoalteromonas ruthenica]
NCTKKQCAAIIAQNVQLKNKDDSVSGVNVHVCLPLRRGLIGRTHLSSVFFARPKKSGLKNSRYQE